MRQRHEPANRSQIWDDLRRNLSRPAYRGAVTDHFDGIRFQNLDPRPHRFGDFLRWRWQRLRGGITPWPEWMDADPGPPPPASVSGDGLRITLINHSTVLIQTGDVNFLTDPIWSPRAGPVPWLGPRRRRPPGIRFEDLPPIHVVLISHNHYDHLDLPTLRRLAEGHGPRFLVPLGNRAFLQRAGIRPVAELDWWQEAVLPGGSRVVCVPARHFAARGLGDRNRTLWCGYVLEGARGAVYFAGDTGLGRHFAMIRARFGPPRLALLPIGAYLPRWFMGTVHMEPADAVRAHEILGSRMSVAIHYGTFPLADDSADEPVATLRAVVAANPIGGQNFRVLDFGRGADVP